MKLNFSDLEKIKENDILNVSVLEIRLFNLAENFLHEKRFIVQVAISSGWISFGPWCLAFHLPSTGSWKLWTHLGRSRCHSKTWWWWRLEPIACVRELQICWSWAQKNYATFLCACHWCIDRKRWLRWGVAGLEGILH